MSTHFSTIVAAILESWLELSDSSLETSGRMTAGQFRIRLDNKSLAQALEVDPEGVAALLLVSKNIHEYMNNVGFSLTELVSDSEACQAKITQARNLLNDLGTKPVRERIDGFKASLTRAFSHYGVSKERSDALLEDEIRLGELRMAAIRSIENLRLDQFTRGVVDAPDVSPTYNGLIHRFQSVAALVDAAIHMKQNISLSLVQGNAQGRGAFYVFTVRNGGNVYLLSDLKQPTNPLASQLSQTESKDSFSRIDRHHFPYKATPEFCKASEVQPENSTDRPTLPVVFGSEGEAWPMMALVDLPDDSLVWTVMVLELIATRFWKSDCPDQELSITGSMMKHNALLSDLVGDHQLIAQDDCLFQAEPLSPEKVTGMSGEFSYQPGSENDRIINSWMCDRYGERANAILETLSATEKAEADSMLKLGHDRVPLGERKSQARSGLLDNNRIATRSEMAADRIYLARTVWAREVERLAIEEYASERKAMLRWYHEAVSKNLPALLDLAGLGNEYWQDYSGPALDWVNRGFSGFGGNHRTNAKGKVVAHRLMVLGSVRDLRKLGYRAGAAKTILTSGEPKSGRPACVETGSVASYCAFFAPKVIEDLELLTGLHRTELPVFLRHWIYTKPYIGNPTFARLDPVISEINNPWHEEDFGVCVYLSKRALKKTREGRSVALPE